MAEPKRTGRAEANRRHLLAVAAEELIRDPDASMDDIARAAGVVRRTVYGHFPSREALIEGITDEAAREVAAALRRDGEDTGSPTEALAGSMAAMWAIGDRYRLLISLAQRSLTGSGIRDRLRPARERFARLLEEGARRGEFTGHLPPEVQALALESLVLGLLQAVNDGLWHSAEPHRDVARACLIAVGVPAADADAAVAAAPPPPPPPSSAAGGGDVERARRHPIVR
jgi:AcrR family transcriptional regulator